MQTLNWTNLVGIHCGSSAIRNVINFYGVDYPEEVCFGIGCGLGFFYNKLIKSKPTEIIHLRAPNMEHIFFSQQSQNFSWKSENDSKVAEKKLINELRKNKPVFLQTDLYYLKYYNSKVHFPGHVVLCVGYDLANRNFLLSDTNFKELQKVSFDDLTKARSSKAEPYPLTYNWFSIDKFEPFKNLAKQIEVSIKLNSDNFLSGQNSLRGTSSVYGILDWLGNVQYWNSYSDSSDIFRFAYQIIVKRGSNGSGFRCIYSDFLKFAQSESRNIKKLNLHKKMLNISQTWNDIGYELKDLSKQYQERKLKKLLLLISKVYSEELSYHLFVKDNL